MYFEYTVHSIRYFKQRKINLTFCPINWYLILQCSYIRDDYNSLTSDIFRSFWLNVRLLIQDLFDAIHSMPYVCVLASGI